MSALFENPWSAAQAGDYRKQELFDIDAPYESVKIPDYMTKIFPEQSAPGHYFGRRRKY